MAMDMSMQGEVEAGRLRRVLLSWTGPVQEFNALFPRGRVPSPKVRAFVDCLRASLQPLATAR